MTDALAKTDKDKRAIELAKTPQEANEVRRAMKAARQAVLAYRGNWEEAFKADELALRAFRKAGQLWNTTDNKRSDGRPNANRGSFHGFEDAGFADRKEALMAGRVAELDDEDFRVYIEDQRDRGRRPTEGGAYQVWRMFYEEGEGTGILYADNEGVEFGFWALPRPLTSTWGSGDVWKRMCLELGETPDVAFGRTDQIPGSITAVDRKTGHEWSSLPFKDNEFAFGYWDPPYDHLYKAEAIEIWRTCRKLAILHTHVYPRSWLVDAKRKGMYAITMGPMKQMRCLQLFEKATDQATTSR